MNDTEDVNVKLAPAPNGQLAITITASTAALAEIFEDDFLASLEEAIAALPEKRA